MQLASNEEKNELRQKQRLLTDKIISCNHHVLGYLEKVDSEPNPSDIGEEVINRLETEINDFKEEIISITQRLKALLTSPNLKNISLGFIQEIQWDKETKRFDIPYILMKTTLQNT